MKVFISWSGDVSRETAQVFRDLLPCVLQGLDVFVSAHDLESGSRWAQSLAVELDSTSFGIVCLTRDNQTAPWLLFEAGALTKHMEGRACGVLLDGLTPANVTGPLSQFQHRRFEENDIHHLLRDLNAVQATPLSSEVLSEVLKKWWPDFERRYTAVLSRPGRPTAHSPHRADRELLEEVLERVRALSQSGEPPLSETKRVEVTHALIRVLRALPPDELTFIHQLSGLLDSARFSDATKLVRASEEVVDRLVRRGLLARAETGDVRVSRVVANLVLAGLQVPDA